MKTTHDATQPLSVFRISGGCLSAPPALPKPLVRVAQDAYNSTCNPPHKATAEEIRMMVNYCDNLFAAETSYPALVSSDEDEADLLCGWLAETSRWPTFPPISSLKGPAGPSRLLAAWCLSRVDAAAKSYLDGDYESAIKELCVACNATADFGFLGGFSDHEVMTKGEARAEALKAPRQSKLREIRAHAIDLWVGVKPGGISAHKCAKDIHVNVATFARTRGFTMSSENSFRTVYEWLRAYERDKVTGNTLP